MDTKQILLDLGLGKNDVKVYVCLLDKKHYSVIEIATKSRVHRVNVYDSLRSLEHKGLVSSITIDKKRFFMITNPQNLLLLAQQKEEQVRSILPNLQRMYETSDNKAQFFEGLNGIKWILNDMINCSQPIYTFGVPRIMPKKLQHFLTVFHRERIAKRIRIQHIYNENAKERIAYLNRIKYSEAHYLPPAYNVQVTTVIYGTKTTFWIWAEEPFSVLIESSKMAHAYKKYFDLLWKLAK